ncbi:unnamed protein product [Dovyalis caffra]|uniref:Uncharacterized protein n=1 Tax=Dovyalis caffra TaxID=77055 RepID=A0AAV1RDZ9_9ROSI|nr:unnamed protein product [Dovyalis caffra]
MPAFSKLYLFVYNSLQAFGWGVSLFAILNNFFSTHSLNGAYASAGDLIYNGSDGRTNEWTEPVDPVALPWPTDNGWSKGDCGIHRCTIKSTTS